MGRGETALRYSSAETEPLKGASVNPGIIGLMERVCDHANLEAARRKVVENKGSGGVDGMPVEGLSAYLREHGTQLREQLLTGRYRPQPIKQVMIPKSDGGERMLGIPTVVDRYVQQAMLQVLQPLFDPTFSPYSFGFRPGCSAHDAIVCAQQFVQGGRTWVVDLDLSKFFDRVDHDILMGRLAKRIADKEILRLIRRYLQAGMLADGLVTAREQGTPQGGPLSPLLANVLLDEVDKELEKRGHSFVRYADDLNVYVGSKRAGERVMLALRGIYAKLKLQVNEDKSAVAPVAERKFLGFTISVSGEQAVVAVAMKSIEKFKTRVRQLTQGSRGRSIRAVATELSEYVRGWHGYFGHADPCYLFGNLDSWIRRRMRCYQLQLWKHGWGIYKGLCKLKVSEKLARNVAAYAGRWWWLSANHTNSALPNKYFDQLGVYRMVTQIERSSNRPVRIRTPGGVAGVGR